MAKKKLITEYTFLLKVRRDGRVLVGYQHPLLVGRVERKETDFSGELAWCYLYEDQWHFGGRARGDAIEGLLQALAKAGRT